MTKAVKIGEAAKQLAIGPKALFQTLREEGAIDRDNMASRDMVQKRLMILSQRSYTPRGAGEDVQRSYYVTLVTELGIHWIKNLLETNNKKSEEGALRH